MKVVVRGLTKVYTTHQGDLRAIGGINLDVRDGEFFGIIGPTGCGKTTLLQIIGRLEAPSTGTVDFAGARPHELSGGMKQKVAIARALANDPEVVLMDEPFANLDAQPRLVMREELLRIWERDKKTVILVTHNLEEAVMLCDRIAVMSSRPGLIKEIVTVDIPRPRTMKSMRDPDFSLCMEKIWNLLRYDVDAALQARSEEHT